MRSCVSSIKSSNFLLMQSFSNFLSDTLASHRSLLSLSVEFMDNTAALDERILSISRQARYISRRVQELVVGSSVCMEMAHFWIREMTASYSANCCHLSCEGYFLANVSSTPARFLYTSIAHLFLSNP